MFASSDYCRGNATSVPITSEHTMPERALRVAHLCSFTHPWVKGMGPISPSLFRRRREAPSQCFPMNRFPATREKAAATASVTPSLVTRHISCPHLSLAGPALSSSCQLQFPSRSWKPFPYRQERAALGSDEDINVAWEFHPVVIEVIIHLLPSDQVTQGCHITDTCKSNNKFPEHWTETNVSPDFCFSSVFKEQPAEGFLQSSRSFSCLRCLPETTTSLM